VAGTNPLCAAAVNTASNSPAPCVPVAFCVRADFGSLCADESLGPWRDLSPHPLCLTETGNPPQQQTHVRFGWDAAALHVLFVAHDSHPWATLRDRDAPLYKEEVFEIFLDPEGDGLGYFELEVNPNNAVLDGAMRKVRSGYRKDFRWQCNGLGTMARIFAGGWAAELRIPFTSVAAAAPVPGNRWRVNFTRIDRPQGSPRELSAWSPTGLAQFHVPEKFGVLEFAD
jgi:hypothetical protein